MKQLSLDLRVYIPSQSTISAIFESMTRSMCSSVRSASSDFYDSSYIAYSKLTAAFNDAKLRQRTFFNYLKLSGASDSVSVLRSSFNKSFYI